jgi:hypothetical protein
MVAVSLEQTRAEARYFYVWMAVACAAVAFGGFAGTYWLQVPAGTFIGPPIIHLHGLLFSAWTLLLVFQAWQAAEGRMEHHRAWGVAGVSLATAMVFVGLATALNGLQSHMGKPDLEAERQFLVLPVTGLALFAVLVTLAVLNVSRPDWHKRLMLVATIGILQAAVARVFFLAINGGGPGARPGLGPAQPVAISIGPGLVVDLLLVAGIVYDWRTRGRPHPAWLWAGGATVALQFLRIPLSTSPAWLAVEHALEGFLT